MGITEMGCRLRLTTTEGAMDSRGSTGPVELVLVVLLDQRAVVETASLLHYTIHISNNNRQHHHRLSSIATVALAIIPGMTTPSTFVQFTFSCVFYCTFFVCAQSPPPRVSYAPPSLRARVIA